MSCTCRYSSLDADSYWKIQPWPEHQRPSRWIIDLAMQKTVALRAQVEERIKMGDAKFSDSLELMTFLANLVGSEHIERFIPLADPANERALDAARPRRRRRHAANATTVATAAAAATATREMPQFVTPRPPRAKCRNSWRPNATSRRPSAPHRSRAPSASPRAAKPPPRAAGQTHRQAARRQGIPPGRPRRRQAEPRTRSAEAAREQVIADAARLVQWGRKWFELAELIARMADRPPLGRSAPYTEGQ